MDKSSLSLITSLVDTEDSNLYKDIYFPIIKYVIVDMYSQDKDNPKISFSVNDLQNGIIERFGITIPIIVLQYCIRGFRQYPLGIEITCKENGKFFDVTKIKDIYQNAEIYTKSVTINDGIESLERLFQEYLSAEKIKSSKTLVDLFSDNTEDVVEFFKSKDIDVKVNEGYVLFRG